MLRIKTTLLILSASLSFAGAALANCVTPVTMRWSDPHSGYRGCSSGLMRSQQINEGSVWQASVPINGRYKIGTITFTCAAGKLVQDNSKTYCAPKIR